MFAKNRFKNWKRDRDYAKGHQSMQEFMDFMRLSNNYKYVNLDWRTPKIAPEFIKTMLDGLAQCR